MKRRKMKIKKYIKLNKQIIKNCQDTFVYCDTDSIKVTDCNKFFEAYKKLCKELLGY